MQTIMTLEACHKCKLPIQSGEPTWQKVSVDPVSSTGQAVIGGRVVASPVRYSHGRGGCEAAMKRKTNEPC